MIKYFASLSEVNEILYFCQFYVPDEEIVRTYHLAENTMFTLASGDNNGRLQKVEHKKLVDFLSIKMFLREIAITRIMKIYD